MRIVSVHPRHHDILTAVRRLLPLIVLFSLFAGCARRAAHHVEGTWRIDVDRQMADPLYKLPTEVTGEMRKKAEDDLRASMADRGVVFAADKVTLKSPGKSAEGTYKVVSSNGDAWSIEMTIDEKSQTCAIEWTDDDHMTMAIGGTPAKMYLARAR